MALVVKFSIAVFICCWAILSSILSTISFALIPTSLLIDSTVLLSITSFNKLYHVSKSIPHCSLNLSASNLSRLFSFAHLFWIAVLSVIIFLYLSTSSLNVFAEENAFQPSPTSPLVFLYCLNHSGFCCNWPEILAIYWFVLFSNALNKYSSNLSSPNDNWYAKSESFITVL